MAFLPHEIDLLKKPSVQSHSKGSSDPMSNDVIRAVYEKRINQGTIVQTRPGTQPL